MDILMISCIIPECDPFMNKWSLAAELSLPHDKDILSLKGG